MRFRVSLYRFALSLNPTSSRWWEPAIEKHSGHKTAVYETSRAIQFYKQQLAIVCEMGYRRGEGIGLWNMSLTLDQLGERAQAIHHAEQALIVREQIEDPSAAQVRAKLAEWREQTNT